jgi:putative copper export protein
VSADLLLIVMRLAHLLAAAGWVGGAIAYAVAGRPAPGAGVRPFSWLAGLCTWILFLSGAALTADRLAGAPTGSLYVAVLALKVGLAIAMVLVAGALAPSAAARLRPRLAPSARRPRSGPLWLSRPYVVLGLGVAIYALGAVLAVTHARQQLRP